MTEHRLLVLEKIIVDIQNNGHNLLFERPNFLYGAKEDSSYDLIFHSQIGEVPTELNIPGVVPVPVFCYPKKEDNIVAMYLSNKIVPPTSLFAVKSDSVEFYRAIPNDQGVEISRETQYYRVKEEDLLERALAEGKGDLIVNLNTQRARIKQLMHTL